MEGGGDDVVVAVEHLVVGVVPAVEPVEAEVGAGPAEAFLRIIADARAVAEGAAELAEFTVGVVRVAAGLPGEVAGLSLDGEGGGAVDAELVEDLRTFEGRLGVGRFQPVVVADQRLGAAERDREVLVGLPFHVGIDEAVVGILETVVALEVEADLDLLGEELGIETEARTAVFPRIGVALVGIDPVILALVAAAELELLEDRVRVVLIEGKGFPEGIEGCRLLRGGRVEGSEGGAGSWQQREQGDRRPAGQADAIAQRAPGLGGTSGPGGP